MVYSGPATILFNGVPVLQAQNAEFSVDSANKDVETLHLGRAGHSRGARKCQLSWRNAVPLDGYEVDWLAICNAQLEVELGLQTTLDKLYGLRGDVRSARYTSSVDNANEVSAEFHGIIVSET